VAQREQVAKNAVAAIQGQLDKTSLDDIHYTELGYAMLHEGLMLSIWDDQGGQVYCIHCNDVKACDDMLYSMQCTTALRDSNYVGAYTEMEYPLEVNGKQVGSVHFGYSGPYYYTAEDVAFIGRLDSVFLYAGLFCALLAAGLGYLMARSIVRPIQTIKDHTRRIGEGDYAPASAQRPYARELTELAQSVELLSRTLESQQKARERTVRDYAHELRTPLSILQANLEAFADGVWEPTPARLESCYEEIQRLNRMLSRLEELAQLYAPGQAPIFTQVDMERLIEDCLEHFKPVCQEKGISLTSSLSQVELMGDNDKLRQVLLNLLSNAVQYTSQGGTLSVSLEKEDDKAVIQVRDTGIGIAPEDLPFIFDYLFRADPSRSRHTGGSGIGLSIVQKIVWEHGGEVTVQSQPGEGSVFTVKLPLRQTGI
jgi:signal transduction histidine kinase